MMELMFVAAALVPLLSVLISAWLPLVPLFPNAGGAMWFISGESSFLVGFLDAAKAMSEDVLRAFIS